MQFYIFFLLFKAHSNLKIMETTLLITLSRNDLKILFKEAIQELVAEENRQANASNSELMTARQAASYLNMALQTLYGYVNRDQIPFLKRGRLYFRKAALDSWLEQNSNAK